MHLRYVSVMIVTLACALTQLPFDANAKVVRMERISMAPYGNFKSGEFVRWDVRIFGELSPTSESIPDLDKAARNSRGMVEYATRSTLIMPNEAVRGNGALLIDVPNRGRPISLSLFNSPRNVLVPLGSFDQGISVRPTTCPRQSFKFQSAIQMAMRPEASVYLMWLLL